MNDLQQERARYVNRTGLGRMLRIAGHPRYEKCPLLRGARARFLEVAEERLPSRVVAR